MLKTFILCGGLGTRLKSITSGLPKCLVGINGVPFIEILIKKLYSDGIGNITLLVGYGQDLVIECVSKSFPDVNFVREQTPLGTGGSVQNAFHACNVDRALVLNGDTYLIDNLSKTYELLNKSDSSCKIVVTNMADTIRYGTIVHDMGTVVKFLEKCAQGSNLVSTGMYLINNQILSKYCKIPPFSIESDVFPLMVQDRVLKAVEVKSQFIDIGIPEDWKLFCDLFQENKIV